MIKPTVGRVVWVWPSREDVDGKDTLSIEPVQLRADEPMAGLVTHVENDRLINVALFDHEGNPFSFVDVPLLQDDDLAPEVTHATWMPYQKGQAARTQELESKLAEGSN